jgi:hypothetical protein
LPKVRMSLSNNGKHQWNSDSENQKMNAARKKTA